MKMTVTLAEKEIEQIVKKHLENEEKFVIKNFQFIHHAGYSDQFDHSPASVEIEVVVERK